MLSYFNYPLRQLLLRGVRPGRRINLEGEMLDKNKINWDAARWLIWLRTYHVGRRNAITTQEMFLSGGMDEVLKDYSPGTKPNTYICGIVNYLRILGFPICSEDKERPRGYFWPETAQEALECKRKLQQRALSQFKPVKGMRNGIRNVFFPEQMEIFG